MAVTWPWRGCEGVGAHGAIGVRGAVSGRPLCGKPLPPPRAPSARGAVEGEEGVSYKEKPLGEVSEGVSQGYWVSHHR